MEKWLDCCREWREIKLIYFSSDKEFLMEKKASSAVVIGAGIAGIRAAFELAENGITVYLCDIRKNTGGAVSVMEKWFPDDTCGMCRSLPFFRGCRTGSFCLRRGIDHPNIKFFPASVLSALEGTAGDFTVTLEKRPASVDPEKCTGCGLCQDVCPVERIPAPWELFGRTKAAGISDPMALRKSFGIDDDACTECGKCAEVCPVQAVDFHRKPEIFTVHAGAVIISSGFEAFDPSSAGHYGYGRYPNVITGPELEYMLSGFGSSGGRLVRPSDGKTPERIAFIQCVGSREKENDFCSSSCCMFALKEANMIRAKVPSASVTVFYMDLRSFGRHCQEYADRAALNGCKLIRSRIPAVRQNFSTGDLTITYMSPEGRPEKMTCDLAVLSVGKKSSSGFASLSRKAGFELNQWGFALTDPLDPVKSTREGIFVCGTAAGPRDISESVSEADAAAALAMSCLEPEALKPVSSPVMSEGPAAVVICTCTDTLKDRIDFKALADFASIQKGVSGVFTVPHLCREGAPEELVPEIRKTGAVSAVVMSCSLHYSMDSLGGLPAEYANIREAQAWVHDPEGALEGSRRSLLMALEKLGHRAEDPEADPVEERTALVVGAGTAGMEAALLLAEQGFQTDLVEKTSEPGGKLRDISFAADGSDMSAYYKGLTEKISASPLVSLHLNTLLKKVSGFSGNFSCLLEKDGQEFSISCGAVILASGAEEYRPSEYLYGKSQHVITQRELETLLASGKNPAEGRSVVMIQCTGSRNEEHRYCSRICCMQAVKNALKYKELFPETEVSVLYRDIRTFGINEIYYTKAREAGVLFHPVEAGSPAVSEGTEGVTVKFYDTAVCREFSSGPALAVLASGVVPGEDAAALAEITGTELSDDGFFREAEMKFRPVDTTREGIFVCGMACAPKNISETIVQARAAAQHVASILRAETLFTGEAFAAVSQRSCSGCEQCIPACPYGARFMDEETGTVAIRHSLCQGCGACSAVCPNGASSQRNFTADQVFALIDLAV